MATTPHIKIEHPAPTDTTLSSHPHAPACREHGGILEGLRGAGVQQPVDLEEVRRTFQALHNRHTHG